MDGLVEGVKKRNGSLMLIESEPPVVLDGKE